MGIEIKKSIQYKNPKLSFGAGGNNERSTLLSVSIQQKLGSLIKFTNPLYPSTFMNSAV